MEVDMLEISHQAEKRTLGEAPPPGHIRPEHGFTLIEVMVTIGILMFGLLTLLQLTEVANRNTMSTAQRVTASNVARRVSEVAKSLPYSDLTQADGPAAIQADAPDLVDSDTSDTKWTVVRASKTIEITPTICAVDDPRDGLGDHDSSFCSGQTSTGTPTDKSPTDTIRMTTLVQADGGRFKTTSVIPINTSIDLPRVTAVGFAAGTTEPIISKSVTSAGFDVTAVNLPTKMSSLKDGSVMESCPTATASCNGSGNLWHYTWSLGTPVLEASGLNSGYCKLSTTYDYDRTYDMGARVFDSSGRTSSVVSPVASVKVNRCEPFAVDNFAATSGRGTPTPLAVDITWAANMEGDIDGYRVYKSTVAPTNRSTWLAGATLVCPSTGPPQKGTGCTDFNPPSNLCALLTDNYYYGIVAVDKDSADTYREGSLTAPNVCIDNAAPGVPDPLEGSRNGSDNVLTWTVPADIGDTITGFRIYRTTSDALPPVPLTDRIAYADVLDACNGSSATGSSCSFTDTIGSANYYYSVTSVDSYLRESPFSAYKKLPN